MSVSSRLYATYEAWAHWLLALLWPIALMWFVAGWAAMWREPIITFGFGLYYGFLLTWYEMRQPESGR